MKEAFPFRSRELSPWEAGAERRREHTLFGAQRDDRIELRGADRRIETEDKAYEDAHADGKRHGRDTQHKRQLERAYERQPADKPGGDPDSATPRAERQRLDEELVADINLRAPIAIRMPISRVRSVTETSMIFMMPMPPTSSEIAATPTSRTASVCCDCCAVCTN